MSVGWLSHVLRRAVASLGSCRRAGAGGGTMMYLACSIRLLPGVLCTHAVCVGLLCGSN